jgi:hypothetical protein
VPEDQHSERWVYYTPKPLHEENNVSSKGTPIRTFRCQDDLWDQIKEAIERRNQWSRDEPWTLSDFMGAAIREKLAKMARSAKRDADAPEERLPQHG